MRGMRRKDREGKWKGEEMTEDRNRNENKDQAGTRREGEKWKRGDMKGVSKEARMDRRKEGMHEKVRQGREVNREDEEPN